jgi:hypothetical protein
MVCCRARLDADQAGRQRGKELRHFGTSEPAAKGNISFPVNAVDLKHVLGEVETDRSN